MLYGEVIDGALQQHHRLLHIGAAIVACIHYLLGPLAGVAVAAQIEQFKVSSAAYPVAAELDASQLRRQSVVVMHTPELIFGTLLPTSRAAKGLERPNFTWVLHAEPGDLSVASEGPRTLVLRDAGGWSGSAATSLMRSPAQPFEVGERIATLDFTVEIVEVTQGRPVAVRVVFNRDLDDPSFVFVTWTGADFGLCPDAGLPCPPLSMR